MNYQKAWTKPQLVKYGTVEDLTAQLKNKRLGSSDDFGVTGVMDPFS
jgi:hypothetical protein